LIFSTLLLKLSDFNANPGQSELGIPV